MAMVPTYNTRPETDLQRLLYEKGFTQWYTFPDVSGFYAALGFCLMLHIYPKYTEIPTFVENTFKQIVARLIEVEHLYKEEVRYSKVEYWTDIGIRCNELCVSLFDQKEHVRLRICNWKMLSPDAKELYSKIVGHFRISLALHQWTDGTPITSHFIEGVSGQNRFFVNLACEDGKISALIHKDMAWSDVPEAQFPYYMKIGSKGVQPLILTPVNLVQNVQQDPRDALIRSLISMNKDLSKILLAGLTEVPFSQRATHEFLKESRNKTAQVLANTIPGCTLDSDEFTRVLELPIAREVSVRPEHTVLTCGEYPELEELISCHSHHFHRSCLRSYLASFAEQQTVNLTCPSCQLALPDAIFNEFPDLKEYLNLRKKEVLNYATTSNIQEMCTGCMAGVSKAEMCLLAHGCKICKNCCTISWARRLCFKCQSQLSNDDYQKMNDFFQNPRVADKLTSLPTCS